MCQLESIDELGQENSWLYGLWRSLIMTYGSLRSRIRSMLLHSARDSRDFGSASRTSQLNHDQIQPGDMVRVRSKDEIERTLDGSGRTRGCGFAPEMYDYCGKEHRVFKRVDRFFDEARLRMCKGSNLFLLEGAHCNRATCHRYCYYFWHASWLHQTERISNADLGVVRIEKGSDAKAGDGAE